MCNNGSFKELNGNYTALSNIVADDQNLSHAAKGLYWQILRNLQKKKWTVYKADLLKNSKEGKKAFNNHWNELKRAGYLKVHRKQNPDDKNKFYYVYELLTVPQAEAEQEAAEIDGEEKESFEEDTENDKDTSASCRIKVVDSHTPQTDTSCKYSNKMKTKGTENHSNSNTITISRESIIERLKEQFMFNYYFKDTSKGGIAENLIEIVADVITSQKNKIRLHREWVSTDSVKSRFLKLEYDHLNYAIEQILNSKTRIKGNTTNYLITCLYESFTSYNTWLFRSSYHASHGDWETASAV